MNHNSDFRYDLEVGLEYEGKVSNMLRNKRVEVKTDFIAHKTGNVAIEYESRGKPSGLATTEAEYYVYIIPNAELKGIMLVMRVDELKRITKHFGKKGCIKYIGDSNSSKAVLIPITRLITNAKKIPDQS